MPEEDNIKVPPTKKEKVSMRSILIEALLKGITDEEELGKLVRAKFPDTSAKRLKASIVTHQSFLRKHPDGVMPKVAKEKVASPSPTATDEVIAGPTEGGFFANPDSRLSEAPAPAEAGPSPT